MRLSELSKQKVAIWGFGREGRSVYAALRRRWPRLCLAIINDTALPADALALLRDDSYSRVFSGEAIAEGLATADTVVKSPGISRYRPEIEVARRAGTVFTSATNLWFSEHPDSRVICVTGTKGKSTTASLIAWLLEGCGLSVALRGNIGVPLFSEPSDPPQIWVVEMSSYQTADFLGEPDVALLLNLYPEHLDWHGSLDRYFADKLRLFAPGLAACCVLNAKDPQTLARLEKREGVRWFNAASGFYARAGWIWKAESRVVPCSRVPLWGRHNISNVCAAFTAVEAAAGARIEECLHRLPSFQSLPHRLQILGKKDGVLFVDDSISTTPQSAVAAVEALPERPLSLLLGGYDRGLDCSLLVEKIAHRSDCQVFALPGSGRRMAAELRLRAPSCAVFETESLREAVELARCRTPRGGAVILSPAAASYGFFRDYRERGLAFAKAAGFGDGGEQRARVKRA